MELLQRTARGSPYRRQDKATYVAAGAFGIATTLLFGASVGDGARWFVVETQRPYAGRLAFRCRSKVGFPVREDRIARYSPTLQRELLASYMDLEVDDPHDPSDLRLAIALLPFVGSGGLPEVTVVAGCTMTLRAHARTTWDVPEDEVDAMYATLIAEGERLAVALAAIESSSA